MALKAKGKDWLPSFFPFAVFKGGRLTGIRDDAPEWAKKDYADWVRQIEEDKKTLTKR